MPFLLLLLTACGLQLPVSAHSDPIVVPGSPLCGMTQLLPPTLQEPVQDLTRAAVEEVFDALGPQVQAEIDAQSTGPATAVHLTRLRLVQAPTPDEPSPSSSLGFLSALEVSIGDDDGLPLVPIAWAHAIPEDAITIDLSLASTVDLLGYLNQGSAVHVAPVLRTCPRHDVVLTSIASVRVQL